MNFKDYFCPVCGQDFKDDDDVVFCPDCGTPHHRSCWVEAGHCVNENLHLSGEDVKHTYTKDATPYNSAPAEDKSIIDSQSAPQPMAQAPLDENIFHIKADSLINGKPAILYDIAVRKNQKYYLPRFMIAEKTNKAPAWNFFAFLLPLAWTLYRKMYKVSAIIMAVYVLIFSVTSYFIVTNEEYIDASVACLQEDPQYLTNIYMYGRGEDVTLTANQKKLIELSQQEIVPDYISTGTSVILFILRFYLGMNANKLYFKKLTNSIEKAEKSGLEGDALKAYIYRKNGVLPIVIAVIVGIFEWMMI